jgi:hypothetical protein
MIATRLTIADDARIANRVMARSDLAQELVDSFVHRRVRAGGIRDPVPAQLHGRSDAAPTDRNNMEAS